MFLRKLFGPHLGPVASLPRPFRAGVAGQPNLEPGVPWLGAFRGTDDTLSLMIDYARGPEGEKNAWVRQWAEKIVKDIAPKDYLSEILAIRGWATSPWLRYTNDARHVEQLKTPYRILLEIQKNGVSLVDCDDIATLIAALAMQLGREVRYGMAGFAGDGEFTHVFACVKEPRSQIWIVCDPVAGTRELEMLRSAKITKTVSVDD